MIQTSNLFDTQSFLVRRSTAASQSISLSGFNLDFYRKVIDTQTTSGIIKPKLEIFASVLGVFPNQDGFDLSEGQISGRDGNFDYLNPIVFQV
jgi:hypothetical protein